MARRSTHRGLVLPFINEDTATWAGGDNPHPDARTSLLPQDSLILEPLSKETLVYWQKFLAGLHIPGTPAPFSWFLADPQHLDWFAMDTMLRSQEEEYHRTRIAFNFVGNTYAVPRQIWRQLLMHTTREELTLVLRLKTGLIKRDINWLATNPNIVPINPELRDLYRDIISSIYDLDAMDYLITRLIVKGYMTQELSIWFIEYLHKVMPSYNNEEEKNELRFIRNSLVEWNKVTRGVPTCHNNLILQLLGTLEPA